MKESDIKILNENRTKVGDINMYHHTRFTTCPLPSDQNNPTLLAGVASAPISRAKRHF